MGWCGCSKTGATGAPTRASWTLPSVPWGDQRRTGPARWKPLPSEDILTTDLIEGVAKAQGCGSCAGDITRVDLSCRKLHGGHPTDAFHDFVRLRTVLADGNLLTMEDFVGLPALRDLSLCHNHIDHIPPYRGPDDWFTNLEMLDLSNNPKLPFSHLPILNHLRKLKYLAIRNCKLTRLPRALRLPVLVHLDVSGNPLGGHASQALLVASRLPCLQRLRLDACGLSHLTVLLTQDDARMLDEYTWGEEDEPDSTGQGADGARCWCHTTEFNRAQHQVPMTCRCGRCGADSPNPECGCRQLLSAGRGLCGHKPPVRLEWARSACGRRATALVHELAELAGGDSPERRQRNWSGDPDRGVPGRLFGVPVFAVYHEPFPCLEQLWVCDNPLARAQDVLSASTWPSLSRLSVGSTPLANSSKDLAVVQRLFGDVINVCPQGVSKSFMQMQEDMREEEESWLLMLDEESQQGDSDESFISVNSVLADEASSVGEEAPHQQDAAREEGDDGSVKFGAWWSSSSSSEVELRPLTAEELWQRRAIQLLARHWDRVWVTRRPPPPKKERVSCRPGEPCLRRRRPPEPPPPPAKPEPIAQCEAGGPCPVTTRRALWKLAWGRLENKRDKERLIHQVEKSVEGRKMTSILFGNEDHPKRCTCCS